MRDCGARKNWHTNKHCIMKTKRRKKAPTAIRGGNSKRRNARTASLALGRILVPVDFSGKSRQALEFAVPLAQQYGGKLFLIHVVEPAYPVTTFPGETGPAAVDPRLVVESCRKALSALALELVPPELLGRTIVCPGRAYLEIVDAAKELKVDLIALSTHGHTGLEHVLLGSTAERVVRHAHCPVLTVRRH